MSREKLLTIVLVPVALVLLSGLLLPMALGWLKDSPHSSPRVEDVVVAASAHAKTAREPRVEFALHNVGDRTAVLQRVTFTIRDVARLRTCFTAGDLLVAKTYGVKLPASGTVGQVIATSPLRRQLRPDEAERLAFTLGTSGARPGEWVAYALAAHLRHDETGHATALGDIVVVSPDTLASDQLFVHAHREVFFDGTRDHVVDAATEIRSFHMSRSVVRCMHTNTIALRRLLSAGGTRSPSLSRLSRWLYSPKAAAALAAKYGAPRRR